MAMSHYKSFHKKISMKTVSFFLKQRVFFFIIKTIYSLKEIFLDICSVGDEVIISIVMKCFLITHNP